MNHPPSSAPRSPEPPLERDVVRDLLAAVALNAVTDDELRAVEAFVETDDDLGVELSRLRNAAGWLGAFESSPPSASLRSDILHKVRDLRSPTARDVYRDVVDDLRGLLGAIAESDGSLDAVGTWTIRDVVAHLWASESLLQEMLDDHGRAIEAQETLDATARAQTTARGMALGDIAQRFIGTAERTIGHDSSAAPAPGERGPSVTIVGVPTPLQRFLVSRAFEMHVHACDIRRALGQEFTAPAAAHYRLMADMGVKSLPAALANNGRSFPGRTARIVLTGHGAGEWTIPLSYKGIAGEPDITFTVSATDFCVLVGDRMRPEDFAATVTRHGDIAAGEADAIADALVAVAATFAGP